MKVRIIDRDGHVKALERRYAEILVKIGRARYAPDAGGESDELDYQTKVVENSPIKKQRGRPPKNRR